MYRLTPAPHHQLQLSPTFFHAKNLHDLNLKTKSGMLQSIVFPLFPLSLSLMLNFISNNPNYLRGIEQFSPSQNDISDKNGCFCRIRRFGNWNPSHFIVQFSRNYKNRCDPAMFSKYMNSHGILIVWFRNFREIVGRHER